MISLISILKGPATRSSSERRRNRWLIILFSAMGIVLGCWQAHAISKIRFSYIAGYSHAIAFILAAYLIVLGLPFLIYWRTRWVGFGLLLAGALSLVFYLGGLEISLRLNRVAWQHEPVHLLGTAQKASAVIYFCADTTVQQIDDFHREVLEVPNPSYGDRRFPVYLSSYLRLAPSQANGYQGVALRFNQGTAPDQIKNYVARIDSDPRVLHVFIDAVPDLIHVDREILAHSRCR